MLRDNLHINQHLRDAVIFVFVSAFLISGLIISQSQTQNKPSPGQANTLDAQDVYDGIPVEVIMEADSLAYREWEYVSQTFPERKYYEYKLEAINHVLTCPHVEGEIIEVYGITCSYRRGNSREWENAVNAPHSFLVFRAKTGNPLECIGDIRTYYEPGTSEFENDVHNVLMNINEQYIFKLLADDSLEQTLEGTLYQYLRHLIPGDYIYFGWKQIAQETASDCGHAYGILLFHSSSGSPLIYSENAEHYVSAIYSTYLLPIRVTYQKNLENLYVVTELWEPSEENYELEIRETFPPETVDLILGEIDQYAIDLLEDLGVVEGDHVLEFFPGGPVWPTYSFDDALDNTQLLGLADYYREGDIYFKPIHEEIIRRFRIDPVGLLNELGASNERTVKKVCKSIVDAGIDVHSVSEIQTNLTDEGLTAYQILEKLNSQKGETLP